MLFLLARDCAFDYPTNHSAAEPVNDFETPAVFIY